MRNCSAATSEGCGEANERNYRNSSNCDAALVCLMALLMVRWKQRALSGFNVRVIQGLQCLKRSEEGKLDDVNEGM